MDILSEPTLGALCALGSALAWALIGLLARSLSPPFNAVGINAIRSTLGAGVLFGWILLTGGAGALAGLTTESLALLSLSVVLASAIGDTAFFESTRWLGLARAMTVSTTYPLLAALLAAAFLGEALTARTAAGSLLTLTGLAMIVASRLDGPAETGPVRPGLATAVLASVAWAASVIVLKPALLEVEVVTAQAIRLPVAAAALWLTPWSWAAPGQLLNGARATLGTVTLLAILTPASSVLFVAGLKYGGVAVGTVLSSTAPMFAIPLGFLFLGERLAPRAILGAVVTVTGIAVLET